MDTQSTTQAANAASGLGKEVFEELLKRFDTLTSKLGEAGGHVWSWYVRQSYVEGIVNLVMAGILILFILLCVKIFYIALARTETDEYADSSWVWMIASPVAGFILTILTLCNIYDGLLHLLNPSYYALQNLLGR